MEDIPILEKLMTTKWRGFNSMRISGDAKNQRRDFQVQVGPRSFSTIATIIIPADAPDDLFSAADDLFDCLAQGNPWGGVT